MKCRHKHRNESRLQNGLISPPQHNLLPDSIVTSPKRGQGLQYYSVLFTSRKFSHTVHLQWPTKVLFWLMKRSCISILATPSLSPICYSVIWLLMTTFILVSSSYFLHGVGGWEGKRGLPLTSLLQAQPPSQREAKVQRTGPDRRAVQLSLRGVRGGQHNLYRD